MPYPSAMPSSAPSPALEVRRRARTPLAAWTVAVAAVVGVTFWYANSPQELPATDAPVTASTPTGSKLYVGVFTPGADFGRTLHVSGVKVAVTADAPVDVRPLLCVGGAFRTTTDPEAFCDELVTPDGRTLTGRDAVVLEVSSDHPGTIDIATVRVGYRDGVQWATQPAGAPAEITVLER